MSSATETPATYPPIPAGTWTRLDGNHLQWLSEPARGGCRSVLRLSGGTHPDTGEDFAALQLVIAEDIDPDDSATIREAMEDAEICILPATALPYLHKAIGHIIGVQADRIIAAAADGAEPPPGPATDHLEAGDRHA
jgi:hypothetical protein